MRAGNLDFMISRFPIRKFPRNFLMRTWVSDPEPIRKFLRNFLLRSRKKFKLFFWPASQRAWAHGPGPDPGPMGQGHGPGPGPMDQGRTRAQWARAMGPAQGPWTGPSFRRPRMRPTLRGGAGGRSPPAKKAMARYGEIGGNGSCADFALLNRASPR